MNHPSHDGSSHPTIDASKRSIVPEPIRRLLHCGIRSIRSYLFEPLRPVKHLQFLEVHPKTAHGGIVLLCFVASLLLMWVLWVYPFGPTNVADLLPPDNFLYVATLIKYCGVGITFGTALYAFYKFLVNQAPYASYSFLTISMVVLSGTIILSLLALKFNDAPLAYNLLVLVTLGIYVYWDCVAIAHYKKKGVNAWVATYRKFRKWDVFVIVGYALLYSGGMLVPYIETNMHLPIVADLISGGLLWAQLVVPFTLIDTPPAVAPIRGETRADVVDVMMGYDTVAHVYDKGNHVMFVERRHSEEEIRKIGVGDVVVDLGAGTGYYTVLLSEKAQTVQAVEPNNQMREILIQRTAQCTNVKILNLMANQLGPINDNSVDTVICCLLLDHLRETEVKGMFGEVARVLKPGGLLYLTDANAYYEDLKQEHAVFRMPNGNVVRISVYPHGIPEVLCWAQNAGLKLRSTSGILVRDVDIQKYPDELRDLLNFPLITEYRFTK